MSITVLNHGGTEIRTCLQKCNARRQRFTEKRKICVLKLICVIPARLRKNLFLLLVGGCAICGLTNCGPEKPKQQKVRITKHQSDSLMAEMEKAYNKMEEDRITNYISTHHAMEKSPKGFWFYVSKENKKGTQVGDFSIVKYSRVISLCDGTKCYSDTFVLKVGNGNEITGMHDALKILKQGEKATFIFPSYNAQGLLGDNNRIPPKSELIYDVEILEVK